MSQPGDAHGPRIVLISGGSAARTLNMALAGGPARLTRIVPVWDSGGSSKAIREGLGLMPVGDIRQALMTMAHGEGRAGDIVRVCNMRLSDREPAAARDEFALFATGRHPALKGLAPEMLRTIMSYLAAFQAAIGPSFDVLNGSIGNFILTGVMLERGRDIDAATEVFGALLGIRGRVMPVARAQDVHLDARLRDGRLVEEQHRVTGLGADDQVVGIDTILLRQSDGARTTAHPAALSAIAEADLVVIGPGSFFTSILPHVHVEGIARALASARAPKAFVANLVECNETRGRTLAELVGQFAEDAGLAGREGSVLSHVLIDRQLFPAGKTVSGNAYLAPGSLDRLAAKLGFQTVAGDFEDVWNRGRHDGVALASALMRLAVPKAVSASAR